MKENQTESQIENQVENQIEKICIRNISCNIFQEQIDLIEELPLGEREKVLYLAIINAFRLNMAKSINQIENQFDFTYISKSISISNSLLSIYNSLSNISKCTFNLLSKTLICKEYSKNYGGKREGSGRKPKEQKIETEKELEDKKNPTLEDLKLWCTHLVTINKISNEYIEIVNRWLNYVSTTGILNKKYKTTQSFSVFMQNLYENSKKCPNVAKGMVDKSIKLGWEDVYKLDYNEETGLLPHNTYR